MLNILNFFDGEGAPATETPQGLPGWLSIVLIVVLIGGMILFMALSSRKQKKQAQEMLSKLSVGCIITTIGGIVGECIYYDDKYIVLETGEEGKKSTMKFVRQAINSIAPAAGSPEAVAEEKAEIKAANEDDEIK